MKRSIDLPGLLIILLASLIGAGALVYPFVLGEIRQAGMDAHQEDALAVMATLTVLCLAALLVEMTSGQMSARAVAAMGVLLAINAALRLTETTLIALPGGFSPIFSLIILCGYVFGARFGFIYGALSLLISGLVTGGVGPWLPYQMLASGWIGLGAASLRPLGRRGMPEAPLLALYGLVWGFVYGAILNLYFWPYLIGAAGGGWEPGLDPEQLLKRYAVFYGVTSLAWDAARAGGNFLLLVTFGSPVLRVLQRFQRRFRVDLGPLPDEGAHHIED